MLLVAGEGLPYRARMLTNSWPLRDPLDLRHTLRFSLPGTGAVPGIAADRAVYALHTPAGPATVTATVSPGRLEASVAGPGATDALEQLPRTVGLEDRPQEFPAEQGILHELNRRHPGLRLGSTGRVFDALLPTVLGQRVTTDEATKSYRMIVAALGEPAPGEGGLRLPPLPGRISALSYEDLHGFGVERSRAQIVIEMARRANRLEEIIHMSRADARRRLAALRGIGEWTVGFVMGSAWGDRDAIPRGDYHLPNLVSWMLAGEPRGDDARMEELLEPYRPYRRRAVILLKLSGVHAPRYGPRSSKSVISRR